jgi:prepilin-type N-terminal cleavage/methylation domain-containing protein
MTRRLAPTHRAAFTLIELLIVIVIIALLAGLLLVGLSKVQRTGTIVTATNDISQLTQACEQFKREYGFFPPSAFAVPTRTDQPGYAVLKKMYPRWNPPLQADMVTIQAAAQPPLAGTTLNGNQSMVYFLGGPAQTGWATDGPYAPTATATATKGPFFDFKQDRLRPGNDPSLNAYATVSTAPVYLDPFRYAATAGASGPPGFGTPYAYMASTEGGKYPPVPCYGVNPLLETATKYINTGTVQIISAGEDGTFGPHPANTPFVPGQGAYGQTDSGADDIANFNNGSKLGVGK